MNSTGWGAVKINGVDVTNKIVALGVNARAHNVTRIALELVDGVDFDGLAEVAVVRSGFGADELCAFLDSIDVEQLERAALARLGAWDEGNTTQAILDVLKEWVSDL